MCSDGVGHGDPQRAASSVTEIESLLLKERISLIELKPENCPGSVKNSDGLQVLRAPASEEIPHYL